MDHSGIMDQLRAKAARQPRRVVYPEGMEPNILLGAKKAAELGIAKPILIGDPDAIARNADELGVTLDGLEILPPASEEIIDELSTKYVELGGVLSKKNMSKRLNTPLYYAAMLLKTHQADAMVAGLTHSTTDVVFAAKAVIGMAEGINTPSSIFLMEVPGYEGSEGNLVVFADCGVCIHPDAGQLADITITTADTVQKLLGWESRIAMLSFSTKGSAKHNDIDKVLEAQELVRARAPELKVDGELQLDAAIVPEVAAKKVPGGSEVAGQANVLIFPDLTAGNIAYKAVQRFAHGNAYGPFLQGFAQVVSDLSRGSSPEDVLGVTTMAVLCAR